MPSPHSSLNRTSHHQSSISPMHLPPPPPAPFSRAPAASRLPIIAHPHPVMLFEGPPGALIPLPLPPPPYSTLPSRSNQRRFFDQVINFNANFLHSQTNTSQGNSGSNNSNNNNNNNNNSSGSANTNATSSSSSSSNNINANNASHNNNGIPTPSCLPSYHHLYSSVSPASLRRQQRRIRREQRAAGDPESSSLTENK